MQRFRGFPVGGWRPLPHGTGQQSVQLHGSSYSSDVQPRPGAWFGSGSRDLRFSGWHGANSKEELRALEGLDAAWQGGFGGVIWGKGGPEIIESSATPLASKHPLNPRTGDSRLQESSACGCNSVGIVGLVIL